MKNLTEKIKGGLSPFKQMHICFNAAKNMKGDNKNKALEMACYYQEIHEQNRDL